jgi:putative ABC transport system substrate-binding protein
MTRVSIVALLALALLSAPLAAEAQQAGKKLPRVVIVSAGQPLAEMLGPDPIAPDYRLLIHTLRDRGWMDGQTVVIERRSAETKWDQVPALFDDVIRQQPDVIVAVTLRMALAAKQGPAPSPSSRR